MSFKTLGSTLYPSRFQAIPWRWFNALVIVIVTLITYFPAIMMDFWTDDYLHIDMVARSSGIEFLTRIFDPYQQIFWYRPLVGLVWKLEYLLWGGNAKYYHGVQIGLHIINSLWLSALVTRLVRRPRVGLLAGLLYGTWSLASMAVYWPAVHDPLAGVFALTAIWLWLNYLESDRSSQLVLAYGAFSAALLSKEITASLPMLFFLLDRWFIAKPTSLLRLIKRYMPLALILGIYAILYLIVTTQSVFTQKIGYSLSEQTLAVFGYFLSLLAMPWDMDALVRSWILIGVIIVLTFLGWKRDRRWWFPLAASGGFTLILAPIPAHLTNPRYLYLPLLISATCYALLFDLILTKINATRWRWAQLGLWLVLVGFIFSNSVAIGERIENRSGFIRQMRQTLRPIFQSYPTFPNNTHLYFLDLPLQSLDLSGMIFLRYGANVTVSGLDHPQVATLDRYSVTYVFYLNEQDRFQGQIVAPTASPTLAPGLPVQFDDGIVLDHIQVSSTTLKRGEALIVLMNWTAQARPSQNYTIFAHLIDANGKLVTGYDSAPQRGRSLTTTWLAKSRIADGLAIPIDDTVPDGEYLLQIGLYESNTMQRLPILNPLGSSNSHTVTLASFRVSK